MKPEELHHRHLSALVTGDLDAAASLRGRFSPGDHRTAVELLRAAVAVCLECRLGPGAGLGAGPVDHDALAALMDEIRRAGAGTEPPPDYLAIEAAVRSLYGEPHLLEPLSDQQRGPVLYALLSSQVARSPWLRANPDRVVERAKAVMTVWLLG
ncbi:hypothetical protein [Glycomyces albidus]|uniref:Uncharacterized protein n=1 Tax=Glycomyces albidus TaxID=2656774 RepID=A0A6L5GFC0_9ACTN|nr:hypothetical protein [Glycomyces albidus]MQM28380.1 hypothetical protein [Glycomyces albidus]